MPGFIDSHGSGVGTGLDRPPALGRGPRVRR
jgi:hypothetical protein